MKKNVSYEDLVHAEENPEWLNTPSPFEQLDDDWVKIIIFFVFQPPVDSISARGTTLSAFKWGKAHDHKVLINRMRICAGMEKECFQSVDVLREVRPSLERTNLINFPNAIAEERLVFRKSKSSIGESVISHIRNAFAHGRLSFYDENGEIYVAMEDVNNKHVVTARMILSKTTLLRWMTVITAGPFISEEELRAQLHIGE